MTESGRVEVDHVSRARQHDEMRVMHLIVETVAVARGRGDAIAIADDDDERHLDVGVARDEPRGGAQRGGVARETTALARPPNRRGLAQRHERLGEGHGLRSELRAQRRIVCGAADHRRHE